MNISKSWKNKLSPPLSNQNYPSKIFKHKTSLTYFEEHNIINIEFSTGKYNFSSLVSTLNLHKGVKQSIILTDAISGTPEQIMKTIDSMHNNVRHLNDEHFNPKFAKNIIQYREDLLSIYLMFNVD